MKFVIEKYFESSTIHGFKYLSKKFHWIERIFWIFSLLTSLILSLILITKLVIKIKIDPIIVLIQDNEVHVSEIDFPAVTACSGLMQLLPEYTYHQRHERIEYDMEYEDRWKNILDERLFGKLKFTKLLMKLERNEIKVENLRMHLLKQLQVIDLISQRGTFAFINFSIPTIDFLDVINEFDKAVGIDEIVNFQWRFSSSTAVSEILTEHGLCTTFNIALPNDLFDTNLISQDFQYAHITEIFKNSSFTEVIPRRALKSSQDVYLDSFIENEMGEAEVWNFIGNFMYWHDPYELPTKFSQTKMLSYNKITNIWIEPQIMEIDESIENDDLKEGQQGYEIVSKYSQMTMKYRQDFVSKFVRRKQFDEIDFFSFVGGLLGLFAGFSALSAVEIFYWFILKIFTKDCNRRSTVVYPFKEIEVRKSNIFEDFFSNSSIHGLSYLKDTNLIEKLFWTFSLTLSITIFGFLMKNIKTQSWTTAVDDNMNFNEKVIQFPAITFLPSRYIHKTLVDRYINDDFNNANFIKTVVTSFRSKKELFKNISALSQCYINGNFTYEKLGINFKSIDRMRHESQVEYFKQQFATWNYKYQVDFTEVRTYFGMGFSFNLVDSEKLFNYKIVNDEFKYKRNISMTQQSSMPKIRKKFYPLMVDSKSHSKFKLIVKKPTFDSSAFSNCRENKIKVHSPNFSPTFMEDNEFAELKDSVNIVVTLKIIKTDRNLRSLSPIDRDCYFVGEKKLKYFKIYTQKYCQMECVMDYMIDYCKCQMTNFIYGKNKKFEFCYGQKRYCILHEERNFHHKYGYILEHNCTCLPECNFVSYQTTFYPAENFDDNETTIIVQLNTDNLILYRKFQHFTFSDAVSYVGGLLGLFAGISMLSIVEIFYFFIMRVFSDVFNCCN
ncbi:hypothetical protein PVAND_015463 [Polypedilum vanderplanki]|uniref:Uncharacterized protein n=1 Tax=Polypedilum vanderplanki TaxID=319348 RepID=A0A9J6BD69_POLVA|nr:hypothetical protein PVAND_015463 [Polypedilum vanderplanki]